MNLLLELLTEEKQIIRPTHIIKVCMPHRKKYYQVIALRKKKKT